MDSLKDVVDICCKRVTDELHDKGVDDVITCKVKEFEGDKKKVWLSLYRSNSQFHSRPIIWINKDLYKQIERIDDSQRINEYDVVCDNIRHEYGHVIDEWGEVRNHKIKQLINENWASEEDFAEGFKEYLKDSIFLDNEKEYDEVFNIYKKDFNLYGRERLTS